MSSKRVSKKDLVEAVYQSKEFSAPKGEIKEAIDTLFEQIKKQMTGEEEVMIMIDSFGTFTKKHRSARQGTNPSTGEKMQIAAKNVVNFKSGKSFNEALNS